MEFITSVFGLGGGLLGYLIPFIFVLSIVVFFHELGHFAVARFFNVKVLTFSVGFGPEIFGWNDKHGTRWKVAWVPLGGYVKFAGDEGVASTPDNEAMDSMSDDERDQAFHLKPVGQRAAIVAAGPIANFLLAIVIFACLFTFIGRAVTAPVVDEVRPDSAAQVAGFEPGDLVVSIDGREIESFSDMQRIISGSAGRTLTIVVDRDGGLVTLTATPDYQEITDRFGNTTRVGLLGITRSTTAENVVVERYDPLTSVVEGTEEVVFVITRTMSYLGGVIAGRESTDQLGGPIRIAQMSGQVATLGLDALLQLAAILSVSIGLINLFPIPMLDGGHLVYYAIEAVRGRPLSERTQQMGFRFGLALVLMLMVFATWNDITQLL